VFRRLFNLLIGLCLVLSFAAAALWLRSCYVGDVFVRVHRVDWLSVQTANGVLVFTQMPLAVGADLRLRLIKFPARPLRVPEPGSWSETAWGYQAIPPDPPARFATPPDNQWLGFRYSSGRLWRNAFREIEVPLWALSLPVPLAVACVVSLRRLRRARRKRAGLCPACGYDLRASPDRCPECGAGGVAR
jgi:hypothetical protein